MKKIEFKQYRKLKNIEISFDKGVNIISGTNGTCKSSILHIISNSFQSVNRKNDWLKEPNCLEAIKNVNNNNVNPKLESLTRGDKEYNNPAPECKGTMYTCHYANGTSLDFRRHNSKTDNINRFSVKPSYKRGNAESLPSTPVIYLGLSRLYAYGEYRNDDEVLKIRKDLPKKYIDEIAKLYNDFTKIHIEYEEFQNMGQIKTRVKFESNIKGIDSNTISAGEDNLLIIITALVSLKYYYESIENQNDIESILLIDELDATLHPAFQVKLLDLFVEYSREYKIQVIFTTHSISLLEYAFNKKCNVIYLLDNITSVKKMEDVDIYKIKMYLHNVIRKDIYLNRTIPVFTEDAEARIFLNLLFDYYERNYKDKFGNVRNLFHFVNINISGDSLIAMFNDSNLLRSTMRSICIVDGDKLNCCDYSNFTMALPGDKSPEEMIFSFSKEIYIKDDRFWEEPTIEGMGYVKTYYRDKILPDINAIYSKIEQYKAEQKSTKGIKREECKKVFNKHKTFFEFLFKRWIVDESNNKDVMKFYTDLKILFKKVAEFHDINPNEWKE